MTPDRTSCISRQRRDHIYSNYSVEREGENCVLSACCKSSAATWRYRELETRAFALSNFVSSFRDLLAARAASRLDLRE